MSRRYCATTSQIGSPEFFASSDTGAPSRPPCSSSPGPIGWPFEHHVLDALAHFGGRVAGPLQAADAHHVAALLVVGSGLNRLSQTSSSTVLIISPLMLVTVVVRIGDGGLVEHVFHQDGLAGQQRVPQRKPGEKAISASFTFISASRMTWSKVPLKLPRRYSVPSGDGQLLVQFRQVGRAPCRSAPACPCRPAAGWRRRQQLVAEVGDLAVLDVEIEHAEVFAVGAGVGDQGLAAAVLDDDRGRHAVMGVAAEDGVDAADAAGHLQVDVHAVVRQHDDDLAPAARASSTVFCMFSSWMPKLQFGVCQRGLAIGV